MSGGPGRPHSLAPLVVLTDRTQAAAPLPEVVAGAVSAGARAVVLREKDLPPDERADLFDLLAAVLAPVGGLLVWAGLAGSAGRAAVHLSAADAFPTPRPALVGRSCHDARDVARAAAEGRDWVFVSPVYPTSSKPGYGPALGPAGLARLAAGAPPVFALGGVTPRTAGECLRAGAAGVAVMGAVMRDPALAADHLAALRDAATGE